MKMGRAGLQSTVDTAPVVAVPGLRLNRVVSVPGLATASAAVPFAPVLCARTDDLFFRAAIPLYLPHLAAVRRTARFYEPRRNACRFARLPGQSSIRRNC